MATAKDKLIRGLKGIKNGLTSQELARKTGVNVKTARNVLALNDVNLIFGNASFVGDLSSQRKCRVTGKLAQVWRLA